MSIETLRALSAIIDFREYLAVFRQLDPKSVVNLARGKSGHQLLSLTEDWMTKAMQTSEEVPHLSQYLKHSFHFPPLKENERPMFQLQGKRRQQVSPKISRSRSLSDSPSSVEYAPRPGMWATMKNIYCRI